MNYWGADKPIHEFKPDELCSYAFNGIWDSLEYMFTYEKVSQKEVDEIIDYVSTIVKTLVNVLKKSLIYFYPQHSKDILEFTNICKSTKDYHLSLYSKDGSLTIIRKGIDALESLEKFSYSYLIHGKMKARLNPCYHEKLPLSNQELKRKINDFEKMKMALMDYCLYAQEVFQSQKMEAINPLVEQGKKRIKQIHAPRQKKDKALLKYCGEMMKKRSFSSAAHLWRCIPKGDKKHESVDGTKIYRDETEAEEEKIYCVKPNGKLIPIGERAFANYFQFIKKSMNDNS